MLNVQILAATNIFQWSSYQIHFYIVVCFRDTFVHSVIATC
jgi:hypothetical protein